MPAESYTPDPALVELAREAFWDKLYAGAPEGLAAGDCWGDEDLNAGLVAVLAALATDGRLLPPETEVRTEWGVWWHSGDSDGIVLSADRISFREHAERRGEERIGDYGITRYTLRTREHRKFADGSAWVGPWLPAPDTDKISEES